MNTIENLTKLVQALSWIFALFLYLLYYVWFDIDKWDGKNVISLLLLITATEKKKIKKKVLKPQHKFHIL